MSKSQIRSLSTSILKIYDSFFRIKRYNMNHTLKIAWAEYVEIDGRNLMQFDKALLDPTSIAVAVSYISAVTSKLIDKTMPKNYTKIRRLTDLNI